MTRIVLRTCIGPNRKIMARLVEISQGEESASPVAIEATDTSPESVHRPNTRRLAEKVYVRRFHAHI